MEFLGWLSDYKLVTNFPAPCRVSHPTYFVDDTLNMFELKNIQSPWK